MNIYFFSCGFFLRFFLADRVFSFFLHAHFFLVSSLLFSFFISKSYSIYLSSLSMATDLCCICHELLSEEIQISICRRNHYVHSNCHAQLVASSSRTCPICRADLIVHGLSDTCRMVVAMRDKLVVENRRLAATW
jgi:hypothetical protein